MSRRSLPPRVPLVWPRPQHCCRGAVDRWAATTQRHTPTSHSGCELALCWVCVAVAPSLTCRLPSHTSVAPAAAAAAAAVAVAVAAATAHSGRGTPAATCCMPAAFLPAACLPACCLLRGLSTLHCLPTSVFYVVNRVLTSLYFPLRPGRAGGRLSATCASRSPWWRGGAGRRTAPALCRAPRSAATHRNTLVSLSPVNLKASLYIWHLYYNIYEILPQTFISFPDPSDLTCDPQS